MKKYLFSLGLFILALGIITYSSPAGKLPPSENKKSSAHQPEVAGIASLPSPSAPALKVTTTQSTANYDIVTVRRVVDGDTIEIATGQKVRYIGINTPETVDPRTTVQCFGKEASDENKKLVEGREVRLEKDVSETDKYGRLLRYIYLQENGQEIFVNEYLVAQGFAQASSYPPDVKYQDLFSVAQKEAQNKNLGLWADCPTGKTLSTITPPSGCSIKGNINSKGEKIYHSFGQKYYNSTVIDTTKGEKYFCSAAEAESAGFRASKI